MGKSFIEYKQKNIGTTTFCTVSMTSTGANGSTGVKKCEYEDGVIVISLSSASASEKMILKNFPFKFEIIDGYQVTRVGKTGKNVYISLNTASAGVASTHSTNIMSVLSCATTNKRTSPSLLKGGNCVVDKTDKLIVRAATGNAAFSFRAYLRVIPART